MAAQTLILAAVLIGQSADTETIKVDKALLTIIESVAVAPTETGKLTKINFTEGDIVRQGSVLGQLDDEIEKLEKSRAEIDLDIAKEQADNNVRIRYAKKAADVAKVEYRRAVESNSRVENAVTKTELDSLRLLSEKALLEIEQAEFEQRTARLSLRLKTNAFDTAVLRVKRRQIISPIAGTIVDINKRAGETVDAQTPVFRILNTSKLRAECRLRASLADFNLKGRPVRLSVAVPQKGPTEFRGKIVFVSPEVSALNGMVRVWAEIDNPDQLLRPGSEVPMSILPLSEKTAQAKISPKRKESR